MQAGRWRAMAVVALCGAVVSSLALIGSGAPPVAAAAGPSSKFVPFGPTRLADTRLGAQAAVEGSPGDNTAVPIRVAGMNGLPASGITAVVANLTVVNTTGRGYVQVFPTGQAAIGASSNLNVDGPGQILSGLVVVPVGDGGRITVFQQRRADLVIDIFGYFTASSSSKAGRYSAVEPARLVDSRTGLGVGAAGKLGAGASVAVQVTGRAGLPSSGVGAVALNLTVTETDGSGFLSVTPSGGSAVSNVNMERAGTTRANLAIVPVDSSGSVRLYAMTGTHVVVDVAGWFSDSTTPTSDEGLFVPVTPGRVLDTRAGARPAAGATISVTPGAALGAGASAGSVMTTLTATEPAGAGFLTAWPAGTPRPFTSNVNVDGVGQTVPNAAIVSLAGGAFDIYTMQGTHVLADVSGYFTTSTPVTGSSVKWAYWGHLFADGQYNAGNDTWTWNQQPYPLAPSRARFEEAAAANGLRVQGRSNLTYISLSKPHPPVPDMRGRPDADVEAYLAAVVEDEGDRCGLIVDDPVRAHVDEIGQLLDQLGVRYQITASGGGFWSLRANAASYPEIQSWPYATTARTPGIGTLPCQ